MPKTQKTELRRKADKIISEIKEKDPKAYKKKDLWKLFFEIEESHQAELELEVTRLRTKLEEMEETFNAIRTGEVDALVISGPKGESVYSLAGAEHPYRVMVETMGEGAVSISQDGTILFSNRSFGRLVRLPLEKIVGTNITQYIDLENRSKFQSALKRGIISSRLEASLTARDGSLIPVYLSTSPLEEDDSSGYSVVVTDLTLQKNEEVMRKHEEFLQSEIAERKRVERELRTSEERYRNIVKDQSELICRFLPDGILTFVNPAFSQMAEMPEDQLLGNSFFMFLADEDISRIVNLMKEVSPADPDRSIEFRVYVKDKTYWMHWVGRGLFDSDGNLIEYQAVGRDMTDQKLAEEAIRESEEKYRRIVETANEGIWMVDAEARALYVNKRMAEMLGYSPEEILGRKSFEFVAEDEREILRQKSEQRRQGLQESYEIKFQKKDGSNLWALANTVPIYNSEGEVVASFGMLTDITRRRQAEEDLRKTKNELEDKVQERTAELQASSLYARSLIETNLDPLVTISTEGKITDVNRATEEVTGVTRQQLICSDFSDYFTDPQKARVGYKRVFRHGFIRDYQLELKHRDGNVTPVLYNASVYRDEAGQIKGVFAAARDITRRKKMEEEMHAAHSKLRAMTSEIIKTEERERQRIATVLHDSIAQTLGAAKMRLELLGEYVSPNGRETQREALDLISESIRQTRSTMAELSPPILNELGFVPALEWLSEQIEKQHGLRVEFKGNGQLKPLNHDLEILLFQGTRELLTNIVKHAKAKKAVVTVLGNSGRVRVEIKDNGIGFQKDESDLKSDLTGGFGLFNIRERLKHFGGQLTIRSSRRGSHVIMSVPIQ